MLRTVLKQAASNDHWLLRLHSVQAAQQGWSLLSYCPSAETDPTPGKPPASQCCCKMLS